MKKFLYSLSLGLVTFLILGTSASRTHAENKKSPLRGDWSFSEFVPATPAFGTPTPIPTTSAGWLSIDENNHFTGHTVVNTGLDAPLGPVLEFDLTGSCTLRQGDLKTGMDCTIGVGNPPFTSLGLFCVAMEGHGGCFDEFRCVRTTAPGVLLIEFKRQSSSTCH